MKLLLDACVWPGAAAELVALGHDVVWAGDWPSLGDEEILAIALKEGRVLVTIDKDFGELAVVFGVAHSGIIRIVNFRIAKHASVCREAIDRYGEELAKGAIITAEPGRLRVRPAPTADDAGE
jgi:predicted nuclease of predicted toxin-antitoxin system